MKGKKRLVSVGIVAFLCGMMTQSYMLTSNASVEVEPVEELRNRQVDPEDIVAVTPPKPVMVRYGKASWYSKTDPGIRKRTANNEIFDDRQLTCAMWGVAFNQRIKVTNLANGKSIVVRVNDRGPHKRFVRRGRILDLSKAAFDRIADLRHGLIEIKVEFL